MASKSLLFSKDHTLDCLLQLKILSKESKHPKAGFYSAVLEALREKMASPDDQFKRYVAVLLGDKDQEKVLDAISKVDKASRARAAKPSSSASSLDQQQSWGLVTRRRYGRPFGVRCFNCWQLGHFQSQCPERRGAGREGPSTKRAKHSESG